MPGSSNGPLHRGEDGYYDEHRHWQPWTKMLPDELRSMPETVPNEYLAQHPVDCECAPCQRYPNQRMLRILKVRSSGPRRASHRPAASRPRGA